MARARPRPRPDRPLRGHPRRHDARPRRPEPPALRPHARGRVPGRLERGRHADGRPPRSPTSPTRRARSPGPTPSTTPPTGRSTSRRFGVDVLICSPYKFFGPHLGLAFGRTRPTRARGGRTRCGPPPTSRSATASRPGRSRSSCSPASSPPSSTSSRSAGTRSSAWERELGARFLAGLPEQRSELHGLPTMEGRVPTFAFSVDRTPGGRGSGRLGERGFAVWHGNYYALEVMKRLGLEEHRRRRPRRLRPLQHGRGGRPAPRASSPGSDDASPRAPRRVGRARRARRSSPPGSARGRPSRSPSRGSRRTRWSTGCSAAASTSTAR